MNISDLISKLQQLEAAHGDVYVEDSSGCLIEVVEFNQGTGSVEVSA